MLPCAVRDAQVGRGADALDARRGGGGRGAGRRAGGDGAGRRPRADQRGALGGVLVREQAVDRVAHERRVTDVAVAVGEGEPERLEVVVQNPGPAREGHAATAEVLHDVQRLGDRGGARRGRPHAVDVVAEVGQLDRVADLRLVALEVAIGQQAGAPRVVGARAGRRLRSRPRPSRRRRGRGRSPWRRRAGPCARTSSPCRGCGASSRRPSACRRRRGRAPPCSGCRRSTGRSAWSG